MREGGEAGWPARSSALAGSNATPIRDRLETRNKVAPLRCPLRHERDTDIFDRCRDGRQSAIACLRVVPQDDADMFPSTAPHPCRAFLLKPRRRGAFTGGRCRRTNWRASGTQDGIFSPASFSRADLGLMPWPSGRIASRARDRLNADLKRNSLRSADGGGMSSLGQRCSALVVSRARPDGKSRSAMSRAIFATCCGCPLG